MVYILCYIGIYNTQINYFLNKFRRYHRQHCFSPCDWQDARATFGTQFDSAGDNTSEEWPI